MPMEQLSSNRISTMRIPHVFRFRICHFCLQQVKNEVEGLFLRIEFENLVCRTALSTVASAKGLDLQRSKCYEQILDQIFGDFTVSFKSMT